MTLRRSHSADRPKAWCMVSADSIHSREEMHHRPYHTIARARTHTIPNASAETPDKPPCNLRIRHASSCIFITCPAASSAPRALPSHCLHLPSTRHPHPISSTAHTPPSARPPPGVHPDRTPAHPSARAAQSSSQSHIAPPPSRLLEYGAVRTSHVGRKAGCPGTWRG